MVNGKNVSTMKLSKWIILRRVWNIFVEKKNIFPAHKSASFSHYPSLSPNPESVVYESNNETSCAVTTVYLDRSFDGITLVQMANCLQTNYQLQLFEGSCWWHVLDIIQTLSQCTIRNRNQQHHLWIVWSCVYKVISTALKYPIFY